MQPYGLSHLTRTPMPALAMAGKCAYAAPLALLRFYQCADIIDAML